MHPYEDFIGNHLTSPPPFDLQVSILAHASYRERIHRLQQYLDRRKNSLVQHTKWGEIIEIIVNMILG